MTKSKKGVASRTDHASATLGFPSTTTGHALATPPHHASATLGFASTTIDPVLAAPPPPDHASVTLGFVEPRYSKIEELGENTLIE